MALACGPVIDQVLRRARDPNGVSMGLDSHGNSIARTFVRQLLDRMQTVVNSTVRSVIGTASLTTYPRQQTYQVSGNLPGAARVIGVRDGSRNLDPIPFESLSWLNLDWWREVGSEFRSFCAVGRDLLIIRPSLLAQSSVTVVYAAITNPLITDADTFQIKDDEIELVRDPVEAMLNLKARDLGNLGPIFERWSAKVKEIQARS